MSLNYRLYFFIKLPRAGGSTIAKQWSEHKISFTKDGDIIKNKQLEIEPRVVVNGDSWRLALGHRYNTYVEPLIHGQIQIAVRALLKTHNVLVDETNTNTSSIIKWLEEDIDAIPVFISTPPHVCKQRAIDTNQDDLIPIIERMHKNLYKTFGTTLEIQNVVDKLRDEAKTRHSFNRIVI
jgi:hypothetical protein